jgi:hypothetical protein
MIALAGFIIAGGLLMLAAQRHMDARIRPRDFAARYGQSVSQCLSLYQRTYRQGVVSVSQSTCARVPATRLIGVSDLQ